MRDEALIWTESVARTYRVGQTKTVALAGVSLDIARGKTLAIVGESGSGKSTLGRLLLGVEAPDAGRVIFEGEQVVPPVSKATRRRLQLIQQNPNGTLNPRRTIGQSVTLPLAVHGLRPRREHRQRAAELLEAVGLPADMLDRYPSALSGGQLQRAAMARALASEPDVLVLDEPTSALDVSVQARVLALLRGLQSKLGITYVFITHDLAVVRHIADRVAVLYRGHLVETGNALELFAQPYHRYTTMLLSSVPVISDEEEAIRPEWPRMVNAAASEEVSMGCPFAPRCPFALDVCWNERPTMPDISHTAACHNPAGG